MFPSDGKVRNIYSAGLALNIAPATGDIPQVTQNQYIYIYIFKTRCNGHKSISSVIITVIYHYQNPLELVAYDV
jgi:hypothetical protein